MVPLNVPNVLTVVRVLLVPVIIVALLDKTSGGDLLAAIVFAVASVTDAIDGYLARSRNAVTTFGKLKTAFQVAACAEGSAPGPRAGSPSQGT